MNIFDSDETYPPTRKWLDRLAFFPPNLAILGHRRRIFVYSSSHAYRPKRSHAVYGIENLIVVFSCTGCWPTRGGEVRAMNEIDCSKTGTTRFRCSGTTRTVYGGAVSIRSFFFFIVSDKTRKLYRNKARRLFNIRGYEWKCARDRTVFEYGQFCSAVSSVESAHERVTFRTKRVATRITTRRPHAVKCSLRKRRGNYVVFC